MLNFSSRQICLVFGSFGLFFGDSFLRPVEIKRDHGCDNGRYEGGDRPGKVVEELIMSDEPSRREIHAALPPKLAPESLARGDMERDDRATPETPKPAKNLSEAPFGGGIFVPQPCA